MNRGQTVRSFFSTLQFDDLKKLAQPKLGVMRETHRYINIFKKADYDSPITVFLGQPPHILESCCAVRLRKASYDTERRVLFWSEEEERGD